MPWGRSKTPGQAMSMQRVYSGGHEPCTQQERRYDPGYACTLSLTRARPAAPSLHDPTPVRSPAPPPASRAAHSSLWLCHL